jgi:hypothetical protein
MTGVIDATLEPWVFFLRQSTPTVVQVENLHLRGAMNAGRRT